MSVSRPRKGKIVVPKPPAPTPTASTSSSKPVIKTNPALLRQIEYQNRMTPKLSREERLARMPIQSRGPSSTDSDKGRARSIALSRTSAPDDDDEEDDLEEVPIPLAGPSSPYPGTPTTPGTNLTRATNTPGTIATGDESDEDEAGVYSDGHDVNTGEEDEGVLTLEIGGETPEERERRIALAMRKKPITSRDRAVRLEIHKMHVIALLAATRIRNRWCCHALLKARLLSLLPHPLISSFNIPPSRFPDRAQRSRLFFDALQALVTWWSQSFFDVSDWTLGMRTRTWDEVQEIADALPKLKRADIFAGGLENPTDWTEAMEKLEELGGGEKLRSPNSLMKKALQQEGSRDVSAQLFVSLARACGLGARLVVSLQPVPWRAEKVVPKKKTGAGRNGKSKASRQGNGEPSDEEESEEDLEEVPIPDPSRSSGGPGEVADKVKKKATIRGAGRRRHQDPADVYRLRKPVPQKLGSASKPKRKKEDLSNQPPVYWAEIFSRSDQRWVPVDPVLGIIRKKAHYEPTADSGPIRMLYVVAFEEDGHARDVTLRYTKNFGAKTVKLRPPPRKDEPDWWTTVMAFLERPYRLNRDELEDAELETSQVSEGMPQHMSGFKDHPIYALERHLKREEVIIPKKEIGKFRGESVYRRANVHTCKTAENWMRSGRRVKANEEPLKWVKQRAVTLQKRRAQELSMQESGEAIQQGLYAEWQTEVYRPPPIKDGIIPQNSFGNIDLYAPTMLPAGAVHLPYKGIAKVAKNLGISYAEACTGFEFKKQRAIPVITGIVVAVENETLVMDAYEESAAAAEERERAKKVDRALKRWARLINGLRVRRRLQAEYGSGDALESQQRNPLADLADAPTKPAAKSAASVIATANQDAEKAWIGRVEDKLPRGDPIVIGDEEDEEPVPDEPTANNEVVDIRSDTSEEMEEVKPPRLDEPADTVGKEAITPAPITAKTPTTKFTLRVNSARAPPVPRPKRQAAARASKRRAPSPAESEAQSSGSDGSAKRKISKRAKRTVQPVPATTRTLRSRSSRTEDQVKEEKEARERIRRAMASDEEMSDLDE